MNGVIALRQLLVASGAVTALVPTARIAAGVLPQGVALPAISITSVSSVDRNIPNPGANRHVRERVQVTVMASTYPSLKAILAAVKGAAADTMPAVSGITDVVVHTDGAGPDFMDEDASIYLGTQDFAVRFSETR